MKTLYLILIGLFISLTSLAQSNKPNENNIQTEIIVLPISQLKKVGDSYGIGVGIDYKYKRLLIGFEALAIQKFIYSTSESDKYLNLDLLIGYNRKINKIDINIASGIGLNIRKDSEYLTVFEGEKKYTKIGIPVRLKANYLLNDKWFIGFGGYTSFTSKVDIYSLLVTIGYKF